MEPPSIAVEKFWPFLVQVPQKSAQRLQDVVGVDAVAVLGHPGVDEAGGVEEREHHPLVSGCLHLGLRRRRP